MANAMQFKLEGGPSKFDLMVALFDNSGSNPRSVWFTIKLADGVTERIELVINSIGRESGSGEDWLYEAYVAEVGVTTKQWGTFEKGQTVSGYYETRRRQGFILPS